MTTLPDRPNTALLVIDVQNGVMAGTHNRSASRPPTPGDRLIPLTGHFPWRADFA
jgi:nicotinamidase-related amidase